MWRACQSKYNTSQMMRQEHHIGSCAPAVPDQVWGSDWEMKKSESCTTSHCFPEKSVDASGPSSSQIKEKTRKKIATSLEPSSFGKVHYWTGEPAQLLHLPSAEPNSQDISGHPRTQALPPSSANKGSARMTYSRPFDNITASTDRCERYRVLFKF